MAFRPRYGYRVCCGVAIAGLLWPLPLAAAEPIEQQLDMRTQNRLQNRARHDADELMRMGQIEIDRDDPEGAIDLWNQALDIYVTLSDAQGIANATEQLAKTYIQLARYEEAEAVVQQRIEITAAMDDLDGQIYGLNNLGTLYIQSGNWAGAQNAFQSALDLAMTADNQLGVGLSLSNLGLVARLQGDLANAQRYYAAATKYRQQAGDVEGAARAFNSLGAVHYELGQPEEALAAFLSGRETASAAQNIASLLTALDGLIDVYSDRGDFAQAEIYLNERLVLTRGAEATPVERLSSYIQLGEYYEAVGDPVAARQAYQQALSLAERVGDVRQTTYVVGRLQVLSSSLVE